MAQIYDVMMQADAKLFKAVYREPSITAYNRLEPRPRTADFSRSLRAEVRDPLWLLTRQWQFGEFDAEDAGSPIDARLMTRQLPVDRVALAGGLPHAYDETIPLEAAAERERVPFTLALKVQVGQQFLRLHDPALRAKYLPAYRAKFAFPAAPDDTFRGKADTLALHTVALRRGIDGEQIMAALGDGSFATAIAMDAADAPAFAAIATRLTAWHARLYSQPATPHPEAWEPDRIAYRLAVASPIAGDEQAVLSAQRYVGGHLDWYAFDAAPQTERMSFEPAGSDSGIFTSDVLSFLPTAASFPGMPNPRFWEMEDRQISFGGLNAKTTDHLLLLFAEMGLIYGNDWFVIPYRLPVNTLCQVLGLVVTDVFGDRTLIRQADQGDATKWQQWSMFRITGQDQDAWQGRYFFLPASTTMTLDGEPIEAVSFTRDEMANMAWAIEDTLPDGTGRGVEGRRVADTVAIAPPPVNSGAPVRYILGTSVPENWIPFLPVHLPSSDQDIRFQRAAMPKLGMPPQEVVKPRGVLLNEFPTPFFITEEEVPFSGVAVRRRFRRVRWYDGRTYLWLGRVRETGRGAGASGLRFDQIEDIPKTGA
jgi:hypothetical protein